MKLKSVFSYVDAAALMGVMTIVQYFLGYVYFYTFFAIFDVSFSMFTLPFDAYMLVNWQYIFWTAGILTMGYFIYAQLTFMSESSLFSKLPKIIQELFQKGGLSIVLLLVFLSIAFITLRVGRQAKVDAVDLARSRKRVEFVMKTENALPSPLYFIARAGNDYLVYSKSDEKAKAQVYVISKDDVSTMKFLRD